MRVSEEEFVKRIAPLVCVKGKKYQRMQAQQTYSVLIEAGFIIVDEKKVRHIINLLSEPSKFETEYGKGRLSLAKEILGEE